VAANLTLDQAVERVRAIGGLAIPAHIDRPANGLIAVLGFLPPNLKVDALEISQNISESGARAKYHIPERVAVVCASDAHWLDAIGTTITKFELRTRSIIELSKAFKEKRYTLLN